MSDQDRKDASAVAMPPWLDVGVLRAMDATLRGQGGWHRDTRSAREAVRNVLLALRPALPFAVLDEGVAVVLPDARGDPPPSFGTRTTLGAPARSDRYVRGAEVG